MQHCRSGHPTRRIEVARAAPAQPRGSGSLDRICCQGAWPARFRAAAEGGAARGPAGADGDDAARAPQRRRRCRRRTTRQRSRVYSSSLRHRLYQPDRDGAKRRQREHAQENYYAALFRSSFRYMIALLCVSLLQLWLRVPNRIRRPSERFLRRRSLDFDKAPLWE